MEKTREKIAEIITHTHKTPLEQADEILLLFSVSGQSELLKKFWEYFDKESVAVNCNDEERDEVIKDFFNSH